MLVQAGEVIEYCCGAWVRKWPDAVMRTRATDVRFKAMSGSRAHLGCGD
jgi:hypothetical protein